MWKKRPLLEGNFAKSLIRLPQFLDDFARLYVDCEWENASLTIQELIEEQRRRLRFANPAARGTQTFNQSSECVQIDERGEREFRCRSVGVWVQTA
jgi:hypothetical protein